MNWYSRRRRGGHDGFSKILPGALKASGVNATLHGFRSSFRDWCSESDINDRVAEAALSHAVPGKVQSAYLRTDAFDKRVEVMETLGGICNVSAGHNY